MALARHCRACCISDEDEGAVIASRARAGANRTAYTCTSGKVHPPVSCPHPPAAPPAAAAAAPAAAGTAAGGTHHLANRGQAAARGSALLRPSAQPLVRRRPPPATSTASARASRQTPLDENMGRRVQRAQPLRGRPAERAAQAPRPSSGGASSTPSGSLATSPSLRASPSAPRASSLCRRLPCPQAGLPSSRRRYGPLFKPYDYLVLRHVVMQGAAAAGSARSTAQVREFEVLQAASAPKSPHRRSHRLRPLPPSRAPPAAGAQAIDPQIEDAVLGLRRHSPSILSPGYLGTVPTAHVEKILACRLRQLRTSNLTPVGPLCAGRRLLGRACGGGPPRPV